MPIETFTGTSSAGGWVQIGKLPKHSFVDGLSMQVTFGAAVVNAASAIFHDNNVDGTREKLAGLSVHTYSPTVFSKHQFFVENGGVWIWCTDASLEFQVAVFYSRQPTKIIG